MDVRVRSFFFIGLSLCCLLVFLVVNELSYRMELRYRSLEIASYQLATDWHRTIGNIRGILYVIEPLPQTISLRQAQLEQVKVRLKHLTQSSDEMDPEVRQDVNNLVGSIQSGMGLCLEILDNADRFMLQDDLQPEFLDGRLTVSSLLAHDAATFLKPKSAYYYFQLVKQLKEMNSFFDNLYSQHLTRLLDLITERSEGIRQGFSIMRLVVLGITTLFLVVMIWQLFRLNAYLRRIANKTSQELILTQKNLSEVTANLQNVKFQQSLFEMVTGVAHELNTPLGNSVTLASFIEDGFQDLIEKNKGGQLTRDTWERMIREGLSGFQLLRSNLNRMKTQIDTFKLLAATNHETNRKIVSAQHYLKERLVQLGAEVSPQLVITTAIEPSADFRLAIENLDIVFTELIKNSVQHGGAEKISIELVRRKDSLQIQFRDFGKGVSPAVLEEMSKPFFTTARNLKHMGLGLSIALSLVVNKLHGTLDFENANPGLVVTIRLPLEIVV